MTILKDLTPKTTDNLKAAQALAADLAGASVDPNEAQKALAYVRSKGYSKALFDYLQAIVNNGDVVIRSRRTIGYYRDLHAACQRHLRPLQDDYNQMLAAFAWSLRLLRYYRAVPESVQDRETEAVSGDESAALPKPSGPKIPAVGDSFTGPILDADESAVIIEVPGFDIADVTGLIKAENMGTRSYRVGNAARVEVLAVRKLKSGRTIVELRPVGKQRT